MEYEICKLCEWKWSPRVLEPTCCPNCKRYDWNKGKKEEEK